MSRPRSSLPLVVALVALPGLPALLACAAEKPTTRAVAGVESDASRPAPADAAASASPGSPPSTTNPGPTPAVDRALADGNDDEVPDGTPVVLPERGAFEKVGAAPVALTRVCDLTAHAGKLYGAHANQPLGTDGAAVSVYDPHDSQRPFRTAFDWNRPGEPTKGGGGGQGFLRVHRVLDDPAGGDDARLYVTDADPPYAGFGMADWGTEGFVFVSDHEGTFARPRMPKHQPPLAPTREGKAGALVLPRAYHVIDAIRWRGTTWASTGSVPPTEKAWRGASPGALHRTNAAFTRMTYAADYPNPYQNGVWRLTFMVRFRGALLAGIQDYDGVEPNDYVRIDCEGADDSTCAEGAKLTVTPKRVTDSGTAQTVRWYADGKGRLYWITWNRDGVVVRVTEDAERWDTLSLPPGSGRPSDVLRLGDRIVVMAENGLYAAPATRLVPNAEEWVQVASVSVPPAGDKPAKKTRSPFVLDDIFCGAPLAALGGVLYVGGQRNGALYRVAAAP